MVFDQLLDNSKLEEVKSTEAVQKSLTIKQRWRNRYQWY